MTPEYRTQFTVKAFAKIQFIRDHGTHRFVVVILIEGYWSIIEGEILSEIRIRHYFSTLCPRIARVYITNCRIYIFIYYVARTRRKIRSIVRILPIKGDFEKQIFRKLLL